MTWSKANQSLPRGTVGHVVGYKAAGKVRVRFPDKDVSVFQEADLDGAFTFAKGTIMRCDKCNTRCVLRVFDGSKSSLQLFVNTSKLSLWTHVLSTLARVC